jgi:inorganic triphosphatase YgiF
MLRVRRVGSRYLQTIKASDHLAPFERDEWEAEIASQAWATGSASRGSC